METFNDLIFSAPPILSPKDHFGEHHPVIYEIYIHTGELSIFIWNEQKLIRSYNRPVHHVEEHMGMCSSYLRSAFDHYHHTRKSLSEDSDLSFLSRTITNIGEQIWHFIHNDSKATEMWNKFIELARQNTRPGVILLRGKDVATWPVECMAEMKEDELGDQQLSVIKRTGKEQDQRNWPVWLQTNLPKKIVFLCGPNPLHPQQLDKLDVEQEVKYMYKTLFRDDSEDDYKSFKFYRKRMADNPSPFEIHYLPENSTLEDIQSLISSISEPYLFIFSGHGLHTKSSTIDGELYWPQSVANKKNDFIAHEQLREVFFNNPPFITIFNCCSTMRMTEIAGYPVNKLHPIERMYQSIPSKNNEPFRIIFANRAETLDSSSLHISKGIANHIVNGGTIFDLLETISSIKPSDFENQRRLIELVKRDRAVGTTLMI